MAAWWDTHITQGFFWGWNPGGAKQHGSVGAHSGIDLAEVNGTPLTSAVAGEVIVAGAYKWGGQVTIRFSTANQDYTLSHLHLSDIAVVVGQHVTVGQFLGKTGGASWSSPIPTRCCSSGPHMHFELWIGDHAPYIDQSPWKPDQAHHPIDPTSFWAALKAAGGPTNDQSGLGATLGASMSTTGSEPLVLSDTVSSPEAVSSGQRAHALLVEFPGFYGIAAAVDAAEYIPPFQEQSAVPSSLAGLPIVGGVLQVTSAPESFGLSLGTWIAQAGGALLLRGLLVFLGVALTLGLLYSLARRSELLPDAEDAAKAAALAAAVA